MGIKSFSHAHDNKKIEIIKSFCFKIIYKKLLTALATPIIGNILISP